MLAKLNETPIKWNPNQVLDKVEHSLNNTICQATNETPSWLLFGIDQKRKFSDTIWDLLNTNMNRNLKEIRNKAHEKIEKSQLQNEKRYNLRRKTEREYEVGNYVEIRNIETTPSKQKIVI